MKQSKYANSLIMQLKFNLIISQTVLETPPNLTINSKNNIPDGQNQPYIIGKLSLSDETTPKHYLLFDLNMHSTTHPDNTYFSINNQSEQLYNGNQLQETSYLTKSEYTIKIYYTSYDTQTSTSKIFKINVTYNPAYIPIKSINKIPWNFGTNDFFLVAKLPKKNFINDDLLIYDTDTNEAFAVYDKDDSGNYNHITTIKPKLRTRLQQDDSSSNFYFLIYTGPNPIRGTSQFKINLTAIIQSSQQIVSSYEVRVPVGKVELKEIAVNLIGADLISLSESQKAMNSNFGAEYNSEFCLMQISLFLLVNYIVPVCLMNIYLAGKWICVKEKLRYTNISIWFFGQYGCSPLLLMIVVIFCTKCLSIKEQVFKKYDKNNETSREDGETYHQSQQKNKEILLDIKINSKGKFNPAINKNLNGLENDNDDHMEMDSVRNKKNKIAPGLMMKTDSLDGVNDIIEKKPNRKPVSKKAKLDFINNLELTNETDRCSAYVKDDNNDLEVSGKKEMRTKKKNLKLKPGIQNNKCVDNQDGNYFTKSLLGLANSVNQMSIQTDFNSVEESQKSIHIFQNSLVDNYGLDPKCLEQATESLKSIRNSNGDNYNDINVSSYPILSVIKEENEDKSKFQTKESNNDSNDKNLDKSLNDSIVLLNHTTDQNLLCHDSSESNTSNKSNEDIEIIENQESEKTCQPEKKGNQKSKLKSVIKKVNRPTSSRCTNNGHTPLSNRAKNESNIGTVSVNSTNSTQIPSFNRKSKFCIEEYENENDSDNSDHEGIQTDQVRVQKIDPIQSKCSNPTIAPTETNQDNEFEFEDENNPETMPKFNKSIIMPVVQNRETSSQEGKKKSEQQIKQILLDKHFDSHKRSVQDESIIWGGKNDSSENIQDGSFIWESIQNKKSCYKFLEKSNDKIEKSNLVRNECSLYYENPAQLDEDKQKYSDSPKFFSGLEGIGDSYRSDDSNVNLKFLRHKNQNYDESIVQSAMNNPNQNQSTESDKINRRKKTILICKLNNNKLLNLLDNKMIEFHNQSSSNLKEPQSELQKKESTYLIKSIEKAKASMSLQGDFLSKSNLLLEKDPNYFIKSENMAVLEKCNDDLVEDQRKIISMMEEFKLSQRDINIDNPANKNSNEFDLISKCYTGESIGESADIDWASMANLFKRAKPDENLGSNQNLDFSKSKHKQDDHSQLKSDYSANNFFKKKPK